ncbi:hypothetical protein Ancab_029842 [Ancistrocladus abbreviatus]
MASSSSSSSPASLEGYNTIAIAIDKDKSSQHALKWAVDHLMKGNPPVILIHVRTQCLQSQDAAPIPANGRPPTEIELQQLFLPYRGFCARKGIDAREVVLHDLDVATALIEYINTNFIGTIVIGASNRNAITRKFRQADVPTCLAKSAPEFCAIYVIAKGKVQSARSANRPATAAASPTSMSDTSTPPGSVSSTPRSSYATPRSNLATPRLSRSQRPRYFGSLTPTHPQSSIEPEEFRQVGSNFMPSNINFLVHCLLTSILQFACSYRSQDSWRSESSGISFDRSSEDMYTPHSGISSGSYPSPPRFPFSPDFRARIPGNPYGRNSLSGNSDNISNPSFQSVGISSEKSDHSIRSGSSQSSLGTSSMSSTHEMMEVEMRKLKHELKRMMEFYQSLSKEAELAKHKAEDLHKYKPEEGHELMVAKLAKEAALVVAELEKQKCKVAVEAAQKSQQLVDMEREKTKNAELRAKREEDERKKATEALANQIVQYRRYSIEEIEAATSQFFPSHKIGEGGYGPVYKAMLNHTPVAMKVLRSDESQGLKQFQKEIISNHFDLHVDLLQIEVLSCMRHPNMVLLLGACPEYGCLVYEYMENGSLEDRLFCKNNTPPIPWRNRFKIAAEIATALLFLHSAKPEPLVHRDLKPANILLDRNYVSKISDVGLARLVPPSVASNVTQYYMTAAAGTFCYIDPEYQQTGLLGVQSDVYSLGIMFLQMITARPAMGLTHAVEKAVEKGTFTEILDPAIDDWPVKEALSFAKLALKCCELRKKDRPDLGSVVLPELNRLRDLGEDNRYPSRMIAGESLRSNPTMEAGIQHRLRLTESSSGSR